MLSVIALSSELVLLALLKMGGIEARPGPIMGILIGIFSIAYFADLQRMEELSCVKTPLMLGYLLRIALVFFDLFGRSIYVLPNSAADAEMFYRLGVATANGAANQRGYFIDLLGWVFRTIGVSRLYVQFLLMLLSVVALHFFDKTMRECHLDENTRYRGMMILCLLPNFAILSSIFLRESLVTVMITISAYCFILWVLHGQERWFVLSLGFVLCASVFHSGSIAVLVGYIVCRLIYDRNVHHLRITPGNMIITAILIFGGSYFINRYSDLFLGKMSNVDSIEDIAAVGQSAGSSYARYVGNSNSIANMIIYTIPRIVFFLFSPMPFQWRGLSDMIAFFFSALFYVVVFCRAIAFMHKGDLERKPLVFMLLLVALSAAFVFAWGTSNTGTAVRHRDKMIIIYGLIYALTLQPAPKAEEATGYIR